MMPTFAQKYQNICYLLHHFSESLEANVHQTQASLTPNHLTINPISGSIWPHELHTASYDEILSLLQLQIALSNIRNESIYSMSKNPKHPKTTMDADLLSGFKELARQQGLSEPEYIIIPKTIKHSERQWLFSTAFRITVTKASHKATVNTFYDSQSSDLKALCLLGEAANQLANFLRQNGYAVFVKQQYQPKFQKTIAWSNEKEPLTNQAFLQQEVPIATQKLGLQIYTSIEQFSHAKQLCCKNQK
jgi:hypothetical protein